MIRVPHLNLLAGPYGMAALALALAAAVAGGGALLLRGRPPWAGAAAPLAVLAGWAALLPRFAASVRPAGVAEHLVAPAAVALAVALLRNRAGTGTGRWLGALGLLFGAWWVAGAAGSGFWRALVAMAVLGAVLAPFGQRAGAGALALLGGLAVAGAPPPWPGVAAVLAAGAWGGSAALVGPAGLLALAVGAAELGAGRLARGRVGAVELACAAAVLAPMLAGPAERWLAARAGRRWGWLARAIGLAGAVAFGAAAAWMGGRLPQH